MSLTDCQSHQAMARIRQSRALFEGNGLLLTPPIDHLFGRSFISFENNGELLISPVFHEESMKKMGIITDRVINVGNFAEQQKEFLEFHCCRVLLKSNRA